MSAIFFKPWIGEDYASGKMFGKRVMVLGEAHYQWDVDTKLDPDLTCRAIRRHLNREHRHAFWTRIGGAFLGYKPSLEELQQFYRSVTFYNYVQESVGFGPKVAPAPEMWTRSEPAFAEVLREHTPQVLIVLGYRLWNHLPDLGGTWDKPIEGALQTQTWRYPLPNGATCLAYGIRHPSSGFTGSKWQPHILKAIENA